MRLEQRNCCLTKAHDIDSSTDLSRLRNHRLRRFGVANGYIGQWPESACVFGVYIPIIPQRLVARSERG